LSAFLKKDGIILNMKKKKIDSYSVKILIVLLLLAVGSVYLCINEIKYKTLAKNATTGYITDTITTEAVNIIDERFTINYYLENNKEKISFYANTFKIDEDTLKEKLQEDADELSLLDTDDLDTLLINYLFDLEVDKKDLFNSKVSPYTGGKEYIIALISYFTNIYNVVDFDVAAAIGEIESGFTNSSMLKVNNIYGGLSSGRLLRYKTMEYGVLKYIKMLNDSYYEKGLNTVETIGKVFNPIYSDNGTKIANPNWVYNVNKAKAKYTNYEQVTDIIDLQNLKVTG
jgi:hypothetical protein